MLSVETMFADLLQWWDAARYQYSRNIEDSVAHLLAFLRHARPGRLAAEPQTGVAVHRYGCTSAVRVDSWPCRDDLNDLRCRTFSAGATRAPLGRIGAMHTTIDPNFAGERRDPRLLRAEPAVQHRRHRRDVLADRRRTCRLRFRYAPNTLIAGRRGPSAEQRAHAVMAFLCLFRSPSRLHRVRRTQR